MGKVLTAANVRHIRRAAGDGTQFKELAEKFGVHPSSIASAAYGRTWRGISKPPPLEPRRTTTVRPANAVLTPRKVASARRAYLRGDSLDKIAGRLGVDESTVRDAVHGISWASVTDPPPVPIGRGGPRDTAGTRTRVRELHRAGSTPSQIATELSLPRSTAHRILRGAGSDASPLSG